MSRLSKTGRRLCFCRQVRGQSGRPHAVSQREVNLEFAVGDRVVHSVYGVGTIQAVSEQQFVGGHSRPYLEVKMAGSTLWVPVDASTSTILRGVAPKQTVDVCRKLLSEQPVSFDQNRTVRQVEIANRMKGGLLPALSRTVRDLRAHSWTKPLSAAEDLLLVKLSKALCAEWAASEGVSLTNALREIEARLRKGRLAYMPESAQADSRASRIADWS